MSEEHSNKLSRYKATFNLSEPRSISNFEALRISDPDGWLV
ncbi:hypothetical protein [Methanobacterium sp. SMA-27]|nr:hypothetical protein [Methanobacterium sp. SMA-27]